MKSLERTMTCAAFLAGALMTQTALASAHAPEQAGRGVFEQAAWIGEAGETEKVWQYDAAMSNRLIRGHESHQLFLDNPLPKHCPQLRKRFNLKATRITSARVAVAGLGFYELWLNGRPADERRMLAAGAIRHRTTALYDEYDVTALLTSGINTVGLWLAPGHSDDFSRHGLIWFAPKRAILRLTIAYADGSTQHVVTDGSWQSRRETEIRYASLYHGETHDAALADAQWATADGTDAGWRGVTVFPDGPFLQRRDAQPVRRSDPRHPVRVTRNQPGVFTLDFGQNRAGIVSFRVRGARGVCVSLQTSELLGADGRIDPWTNRRARATDSFMLAGTGEKETFMPHFTYHGFRFVEIRNWPDEELQAEDVTAWAVHADLTPTSTFACSDATLMKLHNAATWSMLSNMMDHPTDCCMRDERTDCRMDTQTYEDTACQMFDMRRYYAQWVQDGLKSTANNPDWDGEILSLPFRLWTYYGEKATLQRFWPASKVMLDSLTAQHPDHIFTEGYGDWCAPNNGTWKGYFNDVPLVNTSLYCSFLDGLARTAADLGRTQDAQTYARRFEAARKAFHAKFYRADTSSYGDGSQTTYVLPLAFGLVPDDCRAAVKAAFLRRIREHDRGTMDVGIYGARYLGDVLCDLGACELAVDMMTQTNYAGYGNLFAQDATTLWEQWKFRGGMHSHNHAMFSGGASWLYTHLAGIRPARPGYAEVTVQPNFPRQLTFAEATRVTPHGTIRVRWERQKEGIRLQTTLPDGVPATLVTPDGARRNLPAGASDILLNRQGS